MVSVQTRPSDLLLELRNAAGFPYLQFVRLHCDIITCIWSGPVTANEVIAGANWLLDLQVAYEFYRSINDLRNVSGNWADAIPWLTTEFPQLLRERLPFTFHAMVLGQNTGNNLLVHHMTDGLLLDQRFLVRLCDTMPDALDWVRRLPAP